MSVYKRGKVYHYEFEIEKKRYRGSTHTKIEREALAFEREERARVEAETSLDRLDPQRLTVEDVFERYWKAHGHKLSWAATLKAHMAGLQERLGHDTLFRDVRGADVAAALEAYAAETERKNIDGTTRPGSPSDSTVNRRLAVFRQIYLKARDEWELPVQNIVLKKHVRKEPRERVRHITVEQARALLDELPFHLKLVVAWSLITGCRKNETLSLLWSRVNFET